MTEGSKTRVVLATDDHRSGLAVARSLARSGVPFVVVGSAPRGIVGASRAVRSYLVAPDPEREPDTYVDFVLDAAKRFGAQLILPVNDRILHACNRHREEVDAVATLAAAPPSAVRNVLDKRQNLETVSRLGIPCPRRYELEEPGQLPELVAQLGFPVAIKAPGYTDDRSTPFGFKFVVARDERELRDRVARLSALGRYPLFQELVAGVVHNVCCFACAGELVAVHEYRSLRRWQGEGVLREIVPTTPALVAYAESLLQELRWDGVAHLAFFVRADDDASYMETNGRFWASVAGSVRAGWDFPMWTVRYFAHGERPHPPRLEIGSRSRWEYGDLRALIHCMSGGEPPSGTPTTRARAAFDYVSGFGRSVHSDVFELGDPLPAAVEHGRALWRAARRPTRQTGRASVMLGALSGS